MYPNTNPELPYAGIFVKEQINAVNRICDCCDTRVCVIDGFSSKLNYLRSIKQIGKDIKEYQPDVIHVHYGLSALFLLAYPSYNGKTIITLHGGDIMAQQGKWMQNLITKSIIRKVAHVIILNDQMKQIVAEKNPRYSTIKCGVDTTFFSCNKKSPPPSPLKTIIFPADPGRAVKNFTLFEKTIDYVSRKTGRKLNIVMLKDMTRTRLRDALCAADCMLLTSISEGSPQVIKESMACNLPVVSVDVGDVKDVLRGSINCYIARERSPVELGEYVIRVLMTSQRSNSRTLLKKQGLDNDAIARTLLKLYQTIDKSRFGENNKYV